MSEYAPGMGNRLRKYVAPVLAGALFFTACGNSDAVATPAVPTISETPITPHVDTSVPGDLVTETNLDWEHDQIPPTFYLPASFTELEYKSIAEQAAGYPLNYAILSATPATDGTVTLPRTDDLWPVLQEGKTLSLSVGGEGKTDEERAAIRAGWQAALDNPQLFAESVTNAADAYNASSLDLYIQESSFEQRTVLAGLIRAIRDRRPSRPISLVVPAFENAEELAASGFVMAGGPEELQLPGLVDRFSVITYGQDSLWPETAGQPMDVDRTKNQIGNWYVAVGGESEVAPIYSTWYSTDKIREIDQSLRVNFPELGEAIFTGGNGITTIPSYLVAVGAS